MSITFLIRVAIAASTAMFVFSLVAARAEQPEFGEYHRAADYCRGDVTRPIALSPDRRILCFDGVIWRGQDFSVV